MSISSNNNNDKREERRRASFALAGTTTYIVALSLLAVSGIAVICSITTKPMTTAFAQELDNTTRQPGGRCTVFSLYSNTNRRRRRRPERHY